MLPTDAERKLTAQVLRNDKAIVAVKGWKRRHVVRKKTLPVSASAGTRPKKMGEKASCVTAMGDCKMPGDTTGPAHDQNKKSRKHEADHGQAGCTKEGSNTVMNITPKETITGECAAELELTVPLSGGSQDRPDTSTVVPKVTVDRVVVTEQSTLNGKTEPPKEVSVKKTARPSLHGVAPRPA